MYEQVLLERLVADLFWLELALVTEALLPENYVLTVEEARRKAHRVPGVPLVEVQNCMEIRTERLKLFQALIERQYDVPDGSEIQHRKEILVTLLSSNLEDLSVVEIQDDAVPMAFWYKNIVHCDSGGRLFATGWEQFVEPYFEES